MYGAGYKDLLSSKPGSSGRTMKSVMKALGVPPARSLAPPDRRSRHIQYHELCSCAIRALPQQPCSMPSISMLTPPLSWRCSVTRCHHQRHELRYPPLCSLHPADLPLCTHVVGRQASRQGDPLQPDSAGNYIHLQHQGFRDETCVSVHRGAAAELAGGGARGAV